MLLPFFRCWESLGPTVYKKNRQHLHLWSQWLDHSNHELGSTPLIGSFIPMPFPLLPPPLWEEGKGWLCLNTLSPRLVHHNHKVQSSIFIGSFHVTCAAQWHHNQWNGPSHILNKNVFKCPQSIRFSKWIFYCNGMAHWEVVKEKHAQRKSKTQKAMNNIYTFITRPNAGHKPSWQWIHQIWEF